MAWARARVGTDRIVADENAARIRRSKGGKHKVGVSVCFALLQVSRRLGRRRARQVVAVLEGPDEGSINCVEVDSTRGAARRVNKRVNSGLITHIAFASNSSADIKSGRSSSSASAQEIRGGISSRRSGQTGMKSTISRPAVSRLIRFSGSNPAGGREAHTSLEMPSETLEI